MSGTAYRDSRRLNGREKRKDVLPSPKSSCPWSIQRKNPPIIKAIRDNNTKEVYAEFKDFVEDSYLSHKTFVDDLVQYVVPYTWIIREEVYDRISANDLNDKEIKGLLRNIFHDIKTEAFKPFVTGLLFYYHYQDSVTKIPFADDALIDILIWSSRKISALISRYGCTGAKVVFINSFARKLGL